MPSRRPNAELRPREHLTEREVEDLIAAAKGNRQGHRDATMILIAFRHGLRASELCELQWSDVEFETGNLHLRRAKGGATGTHPLLGDELRALRALKREAKSPFIFVSERGAPFSVSGLAKLIERAGIEAKIPFPVHAHMLRHACGYALANKGTIPARCRHTWATAASNRPCATLSWHRAGSRTFGGAKHWLCGSCCSPRSSSSSWPPISTGNGRRIRRTWPA